MRDCILFAKSCEECQRHGHNWVAVVALKDVTQQDAIDFVENHIVCRFGILQTFTTDQGIDFTRKNVVEYANSRNIMLLTSTPYYAKTNGQVEANNKITIM